MKFISVLTPTYNEQENINEVYNQVYDLFTKKIKYNYEHIVIDNSSTDNTEKLLRQIAEEDNNVKIILNTRNFGHIRSSYHGLFQARGDAVITLASDLQDPPDLIPAFIQKWDEGYKVVLGVKSRSGENSILFALRRLYYKTLSMLSDVPLVENFTGFGLYDREVIELLRKFDDPYPYFRGLIADLGFAAAHIEYEQPTRKHGISKNNFYTLYDLAMLGLTNYSKIPLRMATMSGFLLALLSFLIGMFYLIYKLINWSNFELGLAPLVVGLFFLGAVQLIFLGIVGEYVGAIYTQVLNRPLVIEKERINFENPEQGN